MRPFGEFDKSIADSADTFRFDLGSGFYFFLYESERCKSYFLSSVLLANQGPKCENRKTSITIL